MHEDPLSEEQALATLVFEPPPAPLTQLANVKTFTGFDIHILQHFATLTKCCLDDVVLTLTVLHHNPEWGLLSVVYWATKCRQRPASIAWHGYLRWIFAMDSPVARS